MAVLETQRFHQQLQPMLLYSAAVLIIFIFERVGWAAYAVTVTSRLLQPFQMVSMVFIQTVEAPVRWMGAQRAAAAENAELRKRYAAALAQLSTVSAIEKENETLRSLIEKEGTQLEKKVLAAPIISYSLTAIARGTDAGISEGALVYIEDTLVGQIVSVTAVQAQVRLFSHPDAPAVLVQTERGVQGLLQGTGKQLELTQLPIQATISSGERLTTVGQPGIPPNQFVGIVTGVSHSQTAPTQTASVDQLHSFYEASLVEVR